MFIISDHLVASCASDFKKGARAHQHWNRNASKQVLLANFVVFEASIELSSRFVFGWVSFAIMRGLVFKAIIGRYQLDFVREVDIL